MTMTDTDALIDLYVKVAEISDQMLSAARVGNWEQLSALEERCSSHIATLKQRDIADAIPISLRGQKLILIKKILANDRAIRSITEPWMSQLSLMINSVSIERKLSSFYGSGPAE